VAYPSEAGLPVYTDGQYHGPGVYRTNLDAGDATFAPGVYILEAGISASNGTMDASAGVLLFNGCGLNSGGACTPGTGGSISFTGQSSISVTPLQSGTYQQIAIWQPRENTNTLTFAGKTATNVLRGIVYAPAASLSLGSGNGGIQIWCVAGTNIVMSGNGSAIIGQ